MAKKKAETPGMKLCRHCQTEIPQAAKVCPNCRKKQGRKGLIALLVIVIIIILIVIASATSGGDSSSTSTDSQSNPPAAESSATSGKADGDATEEQDADTTEETKEKKENKKEKAEKEVVPEITEEEYKDSCTEIGYKDLARNPDDHAGQKITVTGQIMQVQESGSEAIYLMNVTEDEYGFWDDLVWINAPLDQNNRYLEDDIVQIWGEYQGITTYSTVLSAENSVPEINAVYLALKE